MTGSERYEPQSWVREAGDPVPTCPTCHGLLRRVLINPGRHGLLPALRETIEWRCDQHSHVEPVWVDPRRGDDE